MDDAHWKEMTIDDSKNYVLASQQVHWSSLIGDLLEVQGKAHAPRAGGAVEGVEDGQVWVGVVFTRECQRHGVDVDGGIEWVGGI